MGINSPRGQLYYRGVTRNEKLQVSLTKSEMQALQNLAVKNELRVTDFVRFLIRYTASIANIEPFNGMQVVGQEFFGGNNDDQAA